MGESTTDKTTTTTTTTTNSEDTMHDTNSILIANRFSLLKVIKDFDAVYSRSTLKGLNSLLTLNLVKKNKIFLIIRLFISLFNSASQSSISKIM